VTDVFEAYRDSVIQKLKKGYTLHVMRRGDPVWQIINELHVEGKVSVRLRQLDEQSSEAIVTWIEPGNTGP